MLPFSDASSSHLRSRHRTIMSRRRPILVDDDVSRSEPNDSHAASPQADRPAKKVVEPERDEYGRPKPVVRDRAFIQAERERNLAQQKKNRGKS